MPGNFSDYAQALAAGQSLVPNWRQGDMVEAQLASERLRPQLIQSQIAGQQAEALQRQQAAEREEQDANAFRTDIASLGAKPTPQAYRALAVKYPKFHAAIENAATGLDTEKSQALVRHLAPIQSLIANKQYDKAAAEVKRHIDADKAAGAEPDETDQELYDELTSGDAARQAGAGGMVYGLLNQLNPKDAAKNIADYGTGPQDKRYTVGRALVDSSGQVLYRDPDAEYRTVKNADGSESIVQLSGGGDPVSGGAGAAPGSGAPRSVRNNNPGNLKASAFTRKLPGFKGADKDGFAIFDSPTSGAGAQGALLGSYIDRGFNTVEKIINRWAPASDNNDTKAYIASVAKALNVNPGDTLSKASIPQLQSIISRVEGGPGSSSGGTGNAPAVGGANVLYTSTGGAGQDYRLLSPNEKRERGLDASSQFQIDQKGRITPLGRKTELTEGERKATGLLASMVAAQNSLNGVRGYVPNAVGLALNDLSNKNPIKGNLSQTDRRVMNAQLAFANAILRLESGAAIGKDEQAAKAQTLFPMPGDGPEVQADKRAQREAALKSMRIAAGGGAADIPKVVGGGRGNAQKPAAVFAPQGGRLIGMYQGRQVFQLPNGKRVVAK